MADKFQTLLSVNCLNQEGFSQCIIYTGDSIPFLGVEKGDDLDTVISKVSSFLEGLDDSFKTATKNTSLTSDDIKPNIPSSSISGASSRCALEIVEKTFNYSVTPTQSGTNFTYDLSNIINNLPDKFEHVNTKVTASGSPSSSGSTLISDTSGVSGGFPVSISSYPITVDINSRIKTECGDIDLKSTLTVTNTTGNFQKNISVKDLGNIDTQNASLSDYLSQIQGSLNNLKGEVDNIKSIKTQGSTTSSDIVSVIQNQDAKIADVSSKVSNPSNLSVKYRNLNSVSVDASISNALTDLNANLQSLKSEVKDLKAENNSLKSKVSALQSK